MKYLVVIVSVLFVACSSHKKVADVTLEEPIEGIQEEVVVKPIEQKVVVKPTSVPLTATQLYVQKYASAAIEEMRKFKIPASITLAQGILESGNGNSHLAKKSNNHFGIKCHTAWKGERVYHDDDAKGECFRKYKYVASSYQDHSLFLVTRVRYANLFKLDKGDYKAWAKGLKKAGYATDPKYPDKLISYIEKYKLYEYDDVVLKGKKLENIQDKVEVSSQKQVATVPVVRHNPVINTKTVTAPVVKVEKEKITVPVVYNNTEDKDEIGAEPIVAVQKQVNSSNTVNQKVSINKVEAVTVFEDEIGAEPIKQIQNKVKTVPVVVNNVDEVSTTVVTTKEKLGLTHLVREEDTLYSVSKQYGITVEGLKSLNQLEDNTINIGDELVVSKYTDVVKKGYHVVQIKDTLYSISKQYHITVEELKEFNNLQDNTISIGQQLRIK